MYSRSQPILTPRPPPGSEPTAKDRARSSLCATGRGVDNEACAHATRTQVECKFGSYANYLAVGAARPGVSDGRQSLGQAGHDLWLTPYGFEPSRVVLRHSPLLRDLAGEGPAAPHIEVDHELLPARELPRVRVPPSHGR